MLVPLSVLFIRFYPELGRAYDVGGGQMWTGVGTSKNGLGALCMTFGVGVLWSWIAAYSGKSKHRIAQLMALSAVLPMILYCCGSRIRRRR